MGVKNVAAATVAVIALCTLFLWSASAISYPDYRATAPSTSSCYSCHSGFFDRGTLHDNVHVGSANMTASCRLCHTTTGDIPKLNSSGTDASHSCNGCHLGPGLRLFHAANAPADPSGMVCADCHDTDPSPPFSEATIPPYYSRTDVNVKNPCLSSTAAGGEDYDGSGAGLDNDGDGLVDASDLDCGTVPVQKSTWGFLKSVYP